MAEVSKLVKTGYGNSQSNFPIKIYVTYDSTQSDGATNQSEITCGMKVTTPGSGWTIGPWGKTSDSYVGTKDLTFNGAISNFGGSKTLVTGKKFTVKHNEDGTGKATIYWKWGIKSSWAELDNPSGSFTIDLPTIPRFPILAFNSVSSSLNTLTCNISNSRTGTMTQYQVQRISDGVTIIDETCNGSFSFTLTGLTPNTNYSDKYKVRAYANGGWGDWLTLTSTNMKTTALPTVSTTPSIDLEGVNKIQFTNLNHISSYSVIGKTKNDNTQIYSISNVTTNNFEFTLTASQRENLLKKYTGTARPELYFEITVVSNEVSYRVYNTENVNPTTSYTIPDTTTYQPTFTLSNLINVKDILNTAITGDGTKFITGHNKLQGTIVPMVAKLGATGNTYSINVGNKSTTLNYSTSNQNFTIDNVEGDSIKVTATDTRNKSTSINSTINLIPYSKPTINELNVVRQNGIGEYAMVEAKGKYTNWSGLAVSNSILKVEYRWKLATDGDDKYSSWSSVETITNSDGSWNISEVLPTVFEDTLKYYVQIRVCDKLETVNSTPFLLSTANVFLWKDLKNKRLGINKKPERVLDVGGDIGCDAIYIDGVKVIWKE